MPARERCKIHRKARRQQGSAPIPARSAGGDGGIWKYAIICNMPKVSVIIPVYNVEKYLRQCLDSVVNQTLRDIEIICVDDGSTDGSAQILKEYAVKDPRISVITRKNNGTYSARKAAVAVSRGEWVAFVDPDDLIKPDYCRKLLEAGERSAVDIVQCGVNLLEMRERTREQRAVSERYFNPCAKKFAGDLLKTVFVDKRIGWNLIFRLFRSSVAKPAFEEMPDGMAVNETDALAFYHIAGKAKSFSRIKDRLYIYRYGQGVSTCTEYSLAEYVRTLGKFDVLKAIRFKDGAPYEAMAARMLDNSFKAACARIRDEAKRADAWRVLEERAGAVRFLEYLARRFGNSQSLLAAMLDGTGFIKPVKACKVRRIGLHYFRINRGGVQRVMLHMAECLKNLGYEVVLLIEEPPDEFAFPVPDGVRVVKVPRSLGGRAINAVERVKCMTTILREERIDVYYSHAYSSPMLLWDELVCNRILKIPVIIHYHAAFTAPMHYRTVPLAFELQDKLLRMADRVMALGELDAAYFRMRGIRAYAVPNPIPKACEAVLQSDDLPPKSEKMILWCGRDSWEKHPEDARRVFSLLQKLVPDAECVMLTGTSKDPYSYFSRASLFLSTSETEGFQMTAVEALSHGVPVVSYELGNLDLYQDNPAVFQVPQGDTVAAADMLARLLGSPDIRSLRKLARSSMDRLRAFDHGAFWRRRFAEIEGRLDIEEPAPPSKELMARINKELKIGEAFREKAISWRKIHRRKGVLSSLLSLVRKTPAFLRENGWRYTLSHAWMKFICLIKNAKRG